MGKKGIMSYKILRILLILFLFIAIVSGGIIIVKKKKEQLAKIPPPTLPPLPVHITLVKRGELHETRRYTGIVQANSTGLISARITAQILEIKPREGDSVKQGQLLVILDSKTQRAKIGALKAQMAAAISSQNTLRSIYERDLELFNAKALSKEALDKSRTAFDTAKAKVAEIESNLKNAKAELSYTRIAAPYDGLVINRYMEPGDTAIPGKPILGLEAVNAGYKLVVKVPQAMFSRLTKKTSVELLPPPGRQEPSLELKISRLYPAPPSQGAAMPTCEIALRHRPFGLPPGSSISVLFHLRKATGFIIPARALLEQAIGKSLVYVVNKENRISIIPVQPVLRNEDFVCVDGQLSPGAKIVVAGEDMLLRLHNGDKVHPVEISSDRRL